MKIKERKRMAHIIYGDIVKRIQEIVMRAEKGNLNGAYFCAFQMGMEADIEDSLKKLKKSRRENDTNN